MKATLTELAEIAEVVAAVAIVISLIFVGIQLRENTREARSATADSASSAISNWYIAMGSSEQSSNVVRNFLLNPDSLTADQQYQAILMLHGGIISFQSSYFLANEGTLDIQIHDTILEAIVAVKDTPGWIYYWEQRKALFFEEFQEYVDSLMRLDREVSTGIYAPVTE